MSLLQNGYECLHCEHCNNQCIMEIILYIITTTALHIDKYYALSHALVNLFAFYKATSCFFDENKNGILLVIVEISSSRNLYTCII